jgi:hypothetical protein
MFLRIHHGSWSLVQGEAGKCAPPGKKDASVSAEVRLQRVPLPLYDENKFVESMN